MPKKFTPVRTAAAWEKLSKNQRHLHELTIEIVGALRRAPEHYSLSRLARERGIDPRTVRRYAGPAIRRGPGNRYSAAPRDSLLRRMQFFNVFGQQITLDVPDSRTASKIGRFLNALDSHLQSGKGDPLGEFRGKSIRVGKVTYPFVTDSRVLKRSVHAGQIHIESIYRWVR